ncbi:DUF3189 family protein [Candidatus Contubernalis alkaliaceticus]|uniref:DUF3189 family protein n=1 Tax=Candidatus Contubernalis alkaliaceticus TaxID=338645 RepID=UPI001F4BD711|nr:DUF3189 family protein [Candidatus Contubernalis alkalaceticus]UNC92475.1 DUF3189 family protein [Candidatus Contubernalis alkalaceticus]
MQVIYHSCGGSFTPALAAGIHCGMLPREKYPGKKELLSCSLFHRGTPKNHGVIHYAGSDGKGNEIYFMGSRKAFQILENTLRGVLEIVREDPRKLYFVDTFPLTNLEMRAGMFLYSRKVVTQMAFRLLLKGSQKAFSDFTELIEKVEKDLLLKQLN